MHICVRVYIYIEREKAVIRRMLVTEATKKRIISLFNPPQTHSNSPQSTYSPPSKAASREPLKGFLIPLPHVIRIQS